MSETSAKERKPARGPLPADQPGTFQKKVPTVLVLSSIGFPSYFSFALYFEKFIYYTVQPIDTRAHVVKCDEQLRTLFL